MAKKKPNEQFTQEMDEGKNVSHVFTVKSRNNLYVWQIIIF